MLSTHDRGAKRMLKPIVGYWAEVEPPNRDLIGAASAGADGVIVLAGVRLPQEHGSELTVP
jgi:hypothetical protein